MKSASIAAIVCGLAGGAVAQDVKTPLDCKLGQSMEKDHMLDITNTTKTPLKTETIINLDIKTTAANSDQWDCFALTAPLAPKAHLSHMETMRIDGTPNVCKAYLSSKTPAIIHGSDGSSMTQCDY